MMAEHNFQWSYLIIAQVKVYWPKNLDCHAKASFYLYFSKLTIFYYFGQKDRLFQEKNQPFLPSIVENNTHGCGF
jgi:hypothetical protein